jgi:DNA-binding GntR family transcriptional regulator
METRESSDDKKKKLLREHVYTSIKNSIITGEREPRSRLIEERLAEDMGTSRTPVREAFQKLEKEGLIYTRSQHGFAVKGVSLEEVEEIFGLRSVLEAYAGFLATSRITQGELNTLEEIIRKEDECLTHIDAEEFIRLDQEFHDVLHRAAKSPRLYALLQDLKDSMHRYRVIILRYHRKHSAAVEDHRKIVAEIRAGNAKQVEKLIRMHMTRGEDLIKKKIGAITQRGAYPLTL